MQTTDWKHKTTEGSLKNKALKKRVKELTKSRDDWKAKAIRHKERADNLENDLKKIKDKLNEIMQ
ncbi:hypothetical protein FACS189429_7730 [Bacteroidia bacterium]|nr:hypothetical protein FACS189429_7730 [Bacteroidia bacterium]